MELLHQLLIAARVTEVSYGYDWNLSHGSSAALLTFEIIIRSSACAELGKDEGTVGEIKNSCNAAYGKLLWLWCKVNLL
jgi:hypothetical protein